MVSKTRAFTTEPLCAVSRLDLETANQWFPEDGFPRIIFTPTINGQYPKKGSELVYRVDFFAKTSLEKYLELLWHGHGELNADFPLAAALPETSPVPTDGYTTTNFDLYDPERVIQPLILIPTINGNPIETTKNHIFPCKTQHKAYLYTTAMLKAHRRALTIMNVENPIKCHSQSSPASAPHATHSASARTRARARRARAAAAAADNPAPAAAADNIGRAQQQSRKKPTPATAHTSSSAHSSVPAAAAVASPASDPTVTAYASSSSSASSPQSIPAALQSSNEETLYTPPYSYSIRMHVVSKELNVVEEWNEEEPSPHPLPNATIVRELRNGQRVHRISRIPKDQIELVVERILERFDEGLMKIEERWPVGQATPPKPRGHKETLSIKREDDFMIRQSLCRRHEELPDSKETQPSS